MNFSLLTDLYQLTMAQGYWKSGLKNREATFHMFFRHNPCNGGFSISAGLQNVIDYIENFSIDNSDIEYLASVKTVNNTYLFEKDFLDYLKNIQLKINIDAIPEGNVVFPFEPLLKVSGPIIQCQIIESFILNTINFQTLIATKAARICLTAGDDPVIEFGLRRAQGTDGALTASRAAFIGGCSGTSNVLSGKKFGIPISGTQAHSWILAFDNELEAFHVYAETMPNNCVFLVDTYDTIEGVKKAIQVGKKLRKQGQNLIGIRLDSGDLTSLSISCRKMLDEAGFKDVQIIASNDLDEYAIYTLKQNGAKIDVWGIGTSLITSRGHSALDGVYKLSAIKDSSNKWQYKQKKSEQPLKTSLPGILQVRRFFNDDKAIADIIYNISNQNIENIKTIHHINKSKEIELPTNCAYKDLLVPIFKNGQKTYTQPSLQEIQNTTKQNLTHFNKEIKQLTPENEYFVGLKTNLHNLQKNIPHQNTKVD